MKFYSIDEEQMQRRGIARTGLRLCNCHPEKEKPKQVYPEIFATVTTGMVDMNDEMQTHPERFEKRDGGMYRKED
jgi:hypothetical protein